MQLYSFILPSPFTLFLTSLPPCNYDPLISPGALLCAVGDKVWALRLQLKGNLRMVEQGSATRESRRGGCHCSRCFGDRALDGKGKVVEEMQDTGSGEASLVEKCYIMENSTANR